MIYPMVTIVVLATIFLLHIKAAPFHDENTDNLDKQTDKQKMYENIANILFFLFVLSLIIKFVI